MPYRRASQNRSAEELATWLRKLARVGLHYHDEPDAEACIVCTKCGYAIKADGDRVTRHLHRHDVPKHDRSGLADFIRSLQLPDPKDLPSRPDGSAPHPYLSLQTVFDCRHCEMRSASIELLARHIRQNHPQQRDIAKQDWLRDHIQHNIIVQSWTANDVRNSWIVKPLQGPTVPILQAGFPLDTAGTDARLQAHAEQIVSEERHRLRAEHGQSSPCGQDTVSTIRSAASSALMTNWLRRTGWSVLLEGVHKRRALTLCKLPSRACQPLRIIDSTGIVVYESSTADEQRLIRILLAADWLLDRCYDTVRHTDVAIRRWLRSKFPHQPYKAPFELVSSARSDKLYRSELKQYLCFYLRLSRLPSSTTRAIFGLRTLAETQLESLHALWHDRVWDELGGVSLEAEYADPAYYYHCKADIRQPVEENEYKEDEENEYEEDEDDEEEEEEEEEEEGQEEGGSLYADGVEGGPCLSTDIPAEDAELGRYRSPRDHAIGILLRHMYFSATEEFIDGTAGSTLLVYFTAIRGISTTGHQFLQPSHFTPILARLIYIIRLVCLEAVLPRFAHESIGIPARPRLGQLKRLNEIRVEKLCDGVLSPLGEFLSLLAYGSSLRRAALPSFCFEWSNDSEEISWDGEYCLKMSDFRNLIYGILEAASQCCQRLMFEWEPECQNMRTLRDRLSDTSVGYSFVSDPANNLREEHLLLIERACLSPVDRLLTVDRGTASSSWDIRSVRAYLSRHDDFLRVLMILLHLTGGKGGRISELLSLEIHNTTFQPRGLSLYRGGIMSITRHHKARVWTNNEFQVARFYPQAVSMLIYRYFVYIRPMTNMLLRKCLHRPPLGSLLFDPATSSTAWTTAVFTRELRRLASMTPGIPPGLGAQLYRQLCTAIATRHVRAVVDHFNQHDDVTARAQDDVVMAWQSGHRPLQQATTYGLDGAYPAHLQPKLLQLYENVSRQWHAFLHLSLEQQQATVSSDQALEPSDHINQRDPPLHLAQQKRNYYETIPKGQKDTQPRALKRRRLSIEAPADEGSADNDMPPVHYARQPNENLIAIRLPQPLSHLPVQRQNPQAKRSDHLVYSPFVHLPELHVVVCTICQYAVLADHVFQHLNGPVHKGQFSSQIRRSISAQIKTLPGVLISDVDLKSYKLPGPDTLPIPYIQPPRPDGIGCRYCPYVCCTLAGMKAHASSAHNWANTRGRGRLTQADADAHASIETPWVEGILCQKLFKNRDGSNWFAVSRVLPSIEG